MGRAHDVMGRDWAGLGSDLGRAQSLAKGPPSLPSLMGVPGGSQPLPLGGGAGCGDVMGRARPGLSRQPITGRDPGLGGGASGLDGWVWEGAPPLVLVGCDWRWAGEGAPPQACWLWGMASRLAGLGRGRHQTISRPFLVLILRHWILILRRWILILRR